MGLFGEMKDRLGFGDKPEWQEDELDPAADDYPPDADYDDFGNPVESSAASADVIAFDAYNPDKFENIRIDSGREPRVASLGDDGASGGYSSRKSSYGSSRGTGYGSRRSSSRAGSDAQAAGTAWGTPDDPSFIEHTGPSYTREEVYDDLSSASPSTTRAPRSSLGAVGTHAPRTSLAGDPYSQFDSDVKQIHRDPAAHLSIVAPKAYADVEKVANAAKAGKSVVLDLKNTKPELAKRVLDFSFGVASALNGTVDKAADRVFVFAQGAGDGLTQTERDYLFKQGVL